MPGGTCCSRSDEARCWADFEHLRAMVFGHPNCYVLIPVGLRTPEEEREISAITESVPKSRQRSGPSTDCQTTPR
jgi:hypothetical protein